MTMPNSPISDVIADAFARFDATPRDLPQDAEELQKRIRFNPHLHPRDAMGRFAPSAGSSSTGGGAGRKPSKASKPKAAPKPSRGAPSTAQQKPSPEQAQGRAWVLEQLRRTPNVPESGGGWNRFDEIRWNGGRGLGEQRGTVVGVEDFGDNELAIMVTTPPNGSVQHVYPHDKLTTIRNPRAASAPKRELQPRGAKTKAGGGRTLDSGPSGDDDWDTPEDSSNHLFQSSGKGVSVAFPGPTPDFAQIAADIPRGEHRSVPTANPRETSVRVGRRNDGSAYVSASGPSVHVVNDIPEAPKRDWGYQDGERVEVVGRPPSGASGGGHVTGWTGRKDIFRVKLDNGDTVDLPMEHLKPASKPKSVSREERVSAYREQLRSSGMPSWAREAAVSQFREDLKLDEKLRADVDKQVERTPNVSDGGFGYKRYDSVRFDNGRGLGEQRGMVVGAKNDFSEPAIMVIDSEGNTQHVYPNEQKSTIGPMYAPNGFPWGDVSFDQVGKSITGVFEAACAELDRARAGILKDQMMTGDVPTTVDGPASGRKRKKKGPGDCGPDGAHVAKTRVAGYTRVVNGKVIHVSGYVTGGHAAIDAMSDDDISRRAANPRNKTFNFASRNDPPRGAGMGPNFQTDAEFGRDAPKKPNPGRKSNLERIIAESKDKDQVAAATAELERKYGRVRRPARDKPAAGGGKFTSVKPGEEKVIDGVTIRRSKAIGRMGSTYTLSTPHIGQVVYGRKQGQAKAEHEYLVAHDGGAKKDPKYTWQAGYEIGDVLEDGSVVKAFWRNELIVKRPDGSKGSHSALSTLPKKKPK